MKTLPSTLIEPHLEQVIAHAVRELGAERDCPDVRWFHEWNLRFDGVAKLLHHTGSCHAGEAWWNATREWRLAAMAPRGFDSKPSRRAVSIAEQTRRKLWSAAREAVYG